MSVFCFPSLLLEGKKIFVQRSGRVVGHHILTPPTQVCDEGICPRGSLEVQFLYLRTFLRSGTGGVHTVQKRLCFSSQRTHAGIIVAFVKSPVQILCLESVLDIVV